jgi:hypothetical protein
VLRSQPADLYTAFAAATFAAHCSSSSSTVASNGGTSSFAEKHGGMLPVNALSDVLRAVIPAWGGSDVSYAALQLRCHTNVMGVHICPLDTPTHTHTTSEQRGRFSSCNSDAGSSFGGAVQAALPQPRHFIYAEFAAAIIAAARTEAAAAEGELPHDVLQLVADLASELTATSSAGTAARARLAAAWAAQAASTGWAAAQHATSCSSNSCNSGGGGACCCQLQRRLPAATAVKLLCRSLVGEGGVHDVRLLGWLACLVRQQHLAMQLPADQPAAAAHAQEPGAATAPPQPLLAELALTELQEALLRLLQHDTQEPDPGPAPVQQQVCGDGDGPRFHSRLRWTSGGEGGSCSGTPLPRQQQRRYCTLLLGGSDCGTGAAQSCSSCGGLPSHSHPGRLFRHSISSAAGAVEAQRESALRQLRADQRAAWAAELARDTAPWAGAVSPLAGDSTMPAVFDLLCMSSGGGGRRCSCCSGGELRAWWVGLARYSSDTS